MTKRGKIPFLKTAPWSAVRRADGGVIEGYIDCSQQWERIAEVVPSDRVDGRAAADFIVRVITDHERNRVLVSQLIDALELCLECDGLTWEAEHDSEIVLRRAKAKA